MILLYLLKVSACTVILFIAYHFLLSKLTFFKLNRLFLLTALLFSFAIPALTVESTREISVNQQETPVKVAYSNETSFEQDFNDNQPISDSPTHWSQLIVYVYGAVLLALILRMMIMMSVVQRSITKYKSSQNGRLILVQPHAQIKNCSFLNQIIIDESLTEDERDLVVQHESAHVTQGHAVDKILVNLAVCILWFNPIIYFWRNAIDHNHEFLADQETLKTADKKAYASLLLNLAMPSSTLLAHSFSKLPLKKRIMMLYKKPNSNMKKLIYFSFIPIIALCLLAFVNRKEVIVTKNVAENGNYFTHVKVYKQDYFKTEIVLDPNAKSAFNEAEVVLVLDAGHGGRDAASVALDGQREKDMNLRAVNILKEEATKRGIKIRLTRSSDEYVSLRDRLPVQPATAFISIHHNAMPKNGPVAFGGIEVYVSKLNKNIKIAEELGANILGKLKQVKGTPVQDSLKDASLLLLRESKTPAVLIELGNITDQKSLDFITQESNLREISNLILDGFVLFSKRGY